MMIICYLINLYQCVLYVLFFMNDTSDSRKGVVRGFMLGFPVVVMTAFIPMFIETSEMDTNTDELADINANMTESTNNTGITNTTSGNSTDTTEEEEGSSEIKWAFIGMIPGLII